MSTKTKIGHIAIQQFPSRSQNESQIHLLMAHCTGFSKEMWEPVIEDLNSMGLTAPITTLDFRGTTKRDSVEMDSLERRI
jgi:hypothetical protein